MNSIDNVAKSQIHISKCDGGEVRETEGDAAGKEIYARCGYERLLKLPKKKKKGTVLKLHDDMM